MTDLLHDEAPLTGIYLYCLARPECLSAVKGLAEQDLRGVDERYPVTTLRGAGVAAVVGEVVVGDFSEANLQTLSWVGARAGRHEAVVARIMDASPVLPVKFGTIFRSRGSLAQFLGRHREDIVQALDKLRDKTEWSVKGYLVEEDARRSIAAADPEIRSRFAALSASPGARYLQRKKLDAMIAAALEAGVARATLDIQQALALHAVASIALRRHASAVTGRPERMVLNGSFLLTPEALPDFRAALSDQQDSYKLIGLTLELQGPWPPYNFCPSLSEAKP
jgi:gas vesicle protein GvpL/GvpF